ncbi:hypothetical protein E1A91_D06G172500v1 [Gossypium mustelinum]|uniref:Uncharacterized protein n=1 Tax=Gossypium mustelinum TaxID=34275 RepID=A0A5D2UK31_GOSMU|nr:hypothetical protein E1A91_D06G172500v1 [Gossypium mustelinum]
MPQRRKNPNAFSYFIWLDYKSWYFIIIIFCIQDRHKQSQDYLQMVKITIKPGCSEEVLKVALNSMSSLLGILAFMSYPKHRSSL